MTTPVQLGLTPAMLAALSFIRAYITEHAISPNYAEIGDHLKLASKSSVCRLAKQLQERGYIRLGRGGRSIALVEKLDAILDVLPPKVRSRLAAYCIAHGETPAQVIADAVDLHLDELGERIPAPQPGARL